MTGAHSRHTPELTRVIATTAASVTPAVTGAASGDAPSGTSVSRPRTSGPIVTGISISTVPATVGVKTRRNHDSLVASTNWNREAMTIRLAISPGPPCSRADTHTAMKAPELPIRRI